MTLVIIITGCTTTGTKNFPSKVSDAVAMQKSALSNPLFKEILRELESKSAIEWDKRTPTNMEEISIHSTPTEWLLYKFENDGPYSEEEIRFWWKWNPWSSTTAKTTPNTNTTTLNKWRLDRKTIAIANTLIHERNHSFGLIHPRDQTRSSNKCDFSYISGDLAESILVSMHNLDTYQLSKPMCQALCTSLKNRKMPHSCDSDDID